MEKWVDRFKEVAKPNKQKSENIQEHVNLTSVSAELHHTITPGILLIFTIIIFYPFYISSPISCFMSQPTGAVAVEEKFLNSYCFSLSTYTVFNYSEAAMVELLYPGVGPELPDTEQKRHNYYQYVPYVLVLQCMFFRLTYYWWLNGAHQENGLIHKLVTYIDDFEMLNAMGSQPIRPIPSEPKENQRVHFFEPPRNSTQIMEGGPPLAEEHEEGKTERRKLEKVVDYCYRRLGDFTIMGFLWIFCDILALIVTILNFLLTDLLLGGAFLTYGVSAMNLNWVGGDGQTVNFPRMTKCRVGKFGASGSLENRDALCVLGLNFYFSYIFLFLWFWYLALAICTVFGLVYKFVRLAILIVTPRHFLMSARGTVVTHLSCPELAFCVSKMSISDLIFFCLFCQNLKPMTYTAFVKSLASKFKGKLLFDEGVKIPPKKGESQSSISSV